MYLTGRCISWSAGSDVFSDVSSREDLNYVEPSKEYKELCTAYNQNKDAISSTSPDALRSLRLKSMLSSVSLMHFFGCAFTLSVYSVQSFSSSSDNLSWRQLVSGSLYPFHVLRNPFKKWDSPCANKTEFARDSHDRCRED